LASAASANPNTINSANDILAFDYCTRTAALDQAGDYRNADFFCRNALLLLSTGKSDTPPGAERTSELLKLTCDLASRVFVGDPKGMVIGDPTAPSAIAFVSIERISAYVSLAVARNAIDGMAPDRTLLRQGAAAMCEAFRGFKGSLHDSHRHGLMFGVLAALLAQDLALAGDLIRLCKTCRSHPRHLLVFKKFQKNASEAEMGGVRFLRVTHTETIEEFFGLFNAYRLPLDEGRADVIGEHKRVEYPIAPAPLGNYLFTWLYLQMIADPPVTQTSWTTLREIMTS